MPYFPTLPYLAWVQVIAWEGDLHFGGSRCVRVYLKLSRKCRMHGCDYRSTVTCRESSSGDTALTSYCSRYSLKFTANRTVRGNEPQGINRKMSPSFSSCPSFLAIGEGVPPVLSSPKKPCKSHCFRWKGGGVAGWGAIRTRCLQASPDIYRVYYNTNKQARVHLSKKPFPRLSLDYEQIGH